MPFLRPGFLFASLFWGSVGIGYCIYGMRQGNLPAMPGGVAMIALSYFMPGAVELSAACLLVAGVVYVRMKRGDWTARAE